ncbi:MAG: hypothetical protein R3C68_17910 [Myxococcota bacterium]
MREHALTFVLLSCACAGSQSSSADLVHVKSDATQVTVEGFTIARPSGWAFLAPDASVGNDTVIILQGPANESALAPVVEVSRRALSAHDQRRKPAHILTQAVTEVVQLFESFESVGEPTDVEIAGLPAARLSMAFTEQLAEGGEVKRAARFYGVVHGGKIWLIRCMGAENGSTDADFQKIVQSITIDG